MFSLIWKSVYFSTVSKILLYTLDKGLEQTASDHENKLP